MGENKISASAGCTANVVLVTKKKSIVANAGDSRRVLCRAGKAIQLSQDHKPENQGEALRIGRAGGKIVNGRVNGGLNLSRSFGDFMYKVDKGRAYDEQLIICKPDVK
jgi:protein phosphatase 1G